MVQCLAQDDFGDDMEQMEDPVDLESLTEGSKRLFTLITILTAGLWFKTLFIIFIIVFKIDIIYIIF